VAGDRTERCADRHDAWRTISSISWAALSLHLQPSLRALESAGLFPSKSQ
jgi:hypothetical protein